MTVKKKTKKLSIWINVVFGIFTLLSAFGIPISPEIVSVVEIAEQAIEQIEQVESLDYETETELEK